MTPGYSPWGTQSMPRALGTIVEMHDGEEDNRQVDPDDYKNRETSGGGNYVVIDHLNGESADSGTSKRGASRSNSGDRSRRMK